MAEEKKYGRGKHQMHPNFESYMTQIVEAEAYAGMPGAVRENDGRINWQVSNSKKTSFYKYFEPRFEWWANCADKHELAGVGNSDGRFAIAARLIHPTKMRPCYHCGIEFSVGYYYLNNRLASRFEKSFKGGNFIKGQPIDEAISIAVFASSEQEVSVFLADLFPERAPFFDQHGFGPEAFHYSIHIRSNWLTPGFMSNSPYRLDGLHDYANPCGHRANKDTGRHKSNMRTYNHDRRAFEWWADGDWNLADALFNLAGAGTCQECRRKVEKISPDHVGPLACGFKHEPFFAALCQGCNSRKNRFMSMRDIQMLIEQEQRLGQSMASRHIQKFWERRRIECHTDREAHQLSNELRTIEDFYLRCLNGLLHQGYAYPLAGLVGHTNAYWDIKFEHLNPSRLTFTGYSKKPNHSPGRKSLAARSIRIAFDSLGKYVTKAVDVRRLTARDIGSVESFVAELIRQAQHKVPTHSERYRAWNNVAHSSASIQSRDMEIGRLLEDWREPEPELVNLIIQQVESFSDIL